MKLFTKTQGLWVAFWSFGFVFLIWALLKSLNVIDFSSAYDFLNITNITYVGSVLLVVGLTFGLSSTKGTERAFLYKLSLIWVISIILGVLFDLYSIYYLFQADIQWKTWFILSVPFLCFGLILFFGSMKDETRDRFGSIWLIYLLLALFGFILGILSIVGIYDLLNNNNLVGAARWDHYGVYALIPLAFGLIPLAYVFSAKENVKNLFHKLWIIWLVLALIGVVTYLLSAVSILGDTDILAVGNVGIESSLVICLPFSLVGFILLLGTIGENGRKLVKTMFPVSLLLLIVGIIVFSLNDLLPETFTNPTYGLGFLLILFSSGLCYKALSYDFIPSLGLEERGLAPKTFGKGQVASIEDTDILQKATVEEGTIFLNIEKKSIENSLIQVQNAFRSGKISQAVFNNISTKYQGKINGIENQISSLQVSSKRSTRRSIFEEELGIKKTPTEDSAAPTSQSSASQTSASGTPSSPAGPPAAPPSRSPSPPPMAPPKPPTGPPSPPGGMASKPPSPPSVSGPPKPPGMPPTSPSVPPPPGLPPRPPGPPSPGLSPSNPPPMPGAPPLPGSSTSSADVVGSARSTSIAELRGEMLKELRRLRDIFKEEQ